MRGQEEELDHRCPASFQACQGYGEPEEAQAECTPAPTLRLVEQARTRPGAAGACRFRSKRTPCRRRRDDRALVAKRAESSATAAGGTFSRAFRIASATRSAASAVARSTRRGTASSPPSTGRRGQSAAPSPSGMRSRLSVSSSAPGSRRASARSRARRSPVAVHIGARVAASAGPGKSSSRGPSRISSPARAFASKTAGLASSRGCPGSGDSMRSPAEQDPVRKQSGGAVRLATQVSRRSRQSRPRRGRRARRCATSRRREPRASLRRCSHSWRRRSDRGSRGAPLAPIRGPKPRSRRLPESS